MCGIVGATGQDCRALVHQMNQTQIHRGPDREGEYFDSSRQLAMAMNRLEIVDIDGGAQPMSSEDGRYVLVFNGEIFNAPELRREYISAGLKFSSSHSDTEVLMKLLCHEGTSSVARLNGMFSFAFYDKESGKLTCGRDRFGIKPLYYFRENGVFAFSSEIKSLMGLPGFNFKINTQQLFDYFSLLYVPGSNSIFSSIHRLGPGELLEFDLNAGSLRTWKWWHPVFSPQKSIDDQEWQERIRQTLQDSVKRWSMADVDIGCSLSGGLDSSSIVSFLTQSGAKVRTYSLGFSGDEYAPWNELPLARSVAQKWGTDHHELLLEADELIDSIVEMVWALDEPYGGGLPSWYVYREIARDVKVCMTGTGGDELFGSYGKWADLEKFSMASFLGITKSKNRFKNDYFDKYACFTDRQKRQTVISCEAESLVDTAESLAETFATNPNSHPRDGIASLEITGKLSDEFLLMTDRFSMAHSLEARVPFLDNEMFDLMAKIPAKQRMRLSDPKFMLRETMRDILPDQVTNADKRGFNLPLSLWLRGTLAPLTKVLFEPSRLDQQGLMNPTFYDTYVLPHLSGAVDNSKQIWAGIMFQIWHLVFIEGRGAKPTFTVHDLMN